MDAGRLDKRIVIEAPTTGQNALGEPTRSWATLATVWAAVEPLQGREFWAQQQVQNEVSSRVRIRYRTGITTDCRISYAGRILGIVSIIDPKEAHEELQLMCREGVAES